MKSEEGDDTLEQRWANAKQYLSSPLNLPLFFSLPPSFFLVSHLSLPSQIRRSLYPFLVIMSAATQIDPFPNRSIQDEAESVRIAIRALGDMRNGALLHSPPRPLSIACAYLLHVLRFRSCVLPILSSFSAYSRPLNCVLI